MKVYLKWVIYNWRFKFYKNKKINWIFICLVWNINQLFSFTRFEWFFGWIVLERCDGIEKEVICRIWSVFWWEWVFYYVNVERFIKMC